MVSVRRGPVRSLFALLLVVAMISTLVGVTAAESDRSHDIEPADEVYVTGGEEAVLVYHGDTTDEVTGEFAVDITEGVLHSRGTAKRGAEVDGTLSAQLDSDELSGKSTGTVERPQTLHDVDLRIDGEQTDETNAFDGELLLVTEPDSAAPFESMKTSGKIVAGPDTFALRGRLSQRHDPALIAANATDARLNVSAVETETGYAVDVESVEQLQDWEVDAWRTPEDAKAQLANQLALQSLEPDADTDITVHEHDLEANELTLEYTVEYAGVDDALSELVEQTLQETALDVTETEIVEFVETTEEFTVEAFEFRIREQESETAVVWDVEVSGYDHVALGGIDLIATGGEFFEKADTDEAKAVREAQHAAEVVQTTEWSLAVEYADDVTRIDGSLATTSENWASYVQELDARGVDRPASSASLSAWTVGDDLEFDATFAVEQEEFANDVLRTLVDEFDDDDELAPVLSGFSSSELHVAKADVNATGSSLEYRTGATFEPSDEFVTTLEDAVGEGAVTSVYVELDETSKDAYVRITDFPTEDPQQHPAVDDETAVFDPGEWDRELPSMNTDEVYEYLDVDEGNDEGDDADPLSGFGIVTAIFGVLVAVAVVRR